MNFMYIILTYLITACLVTQLPKDMKCSMNHRKFQFLTGGNEFIMLRMM